MAVSKKACTKCKGTGNVKMVRRKSPRGHVCRSLKELQQPCICTITSKEIVYAAITKEELMLIAEAMISNGSYGLNKHWRQCNKGHPYYVGDCGTPEERSRCYECKVPIGYGDVIIDLVAEN